MRTGKDILTQRPEPVSSWRDVDARLVDLFELIAGRQRTDYGDKRELLKDTIPGLETDISTLETDVAARPRMFTSEPTTPYSVGDLWIASNQTKVCVTAAASGAYNAAHWEYLRPQVDDSTLAVNASNQVQVKDYGINTTQLATNSNNEVDREYTEGRTTDDLPESTETPDRIELAKVSGSHWANTIVTIDFSCSIYNASGGDNTVMARFFLEWSTDDSTWTDLDATYHPEMECTRADSRITSFAMHRTIASPLSSAGTLYVRVSGQSDEADKIYAQNRALTMIEWKRST